MTAGVRKQQLPGKLGARGLIAPTAPRVGDQSVSGGNPPQGIFPCKGGGANDYIYVYTSRANPEHWKRRLQVIGRPDLIGDVRYETPAARLAHEAEIVALVSDWTKQHDTHEAMRLLGGAGIPAGAVLDTKELIEDATLQQRAVLQVMQHPVVKGDRSRPGRSATTVRRRRSRRRPCWENIPLKCSKAGGD